jgi:hypothetical protein
MTHDACTGAGQFETEEPGPFCLHRYARRWPNSLPSKMTRGEVTPQSIDNGRRRWEGLRRPIRDWRVRGRTYLDLNAQSRNMLLQTINNPRHLD